MGWTEFHGEKLKKLTHEQTKEALIETAQATLAQSQDLVPHDEGTLQETGIVKVNPDNDHEVAISYGGGFGTDDARLPYAVKQHEVPMNHTDGRQHNFLKKPIDSFAPGALKRSLKKKLSKTWS